MTHQQAQVRLKAKDECACNDCDISRAILGGQRIQQTVNGDLIQPEFPPVPKLDYNKYPVVSIMKKSSDQYLPTTSATRLELSGTSGYYYTPKKGPRKMAAILVCERCDSIVKGTADGYVQYRLSPESDDAGMQICPGCIEEFVTWKDAENPNPLRNGGKPYVKPYESPKDPDDMSEVSVIQMAGKLFEKLLANPQLAIDAGVADKLPTTKKDDNNV